MRAQVFLVLCLLVSILTAPAALVGSEGVVGLHHWKQWRHESGLEVTAVDLVEYSCRQRARKIFLELAGGERAVLESIYEPPRGEAVLAIELEEHRWRLELRIRLEETIHLSTPYSLGDGLFWQRINEKGPFPAHTAIVLDGEEKLKVEAPVQFPLAHDLRSTVPVELLHGALDRTGRAEISGALQRLGALATAGDPGADILGPLRGFVELVVSGLATEPSATTSDAEAAAGWSRVDLQGFGGTRPVAPDVMRFLSQFSSLSDPGDPLEGLHAPADGGCPQP